MLAHLSAERENVFPAALSTILLLVAPVCTVCTDAPNTLWLLWLTLPLPPDSWSNRVSPVSEAAASSKTALDSPYGFSTELVLS